MKVIEENAIWLDARLTEEEMNSLWQIISEENLEDYRDQLVGHVTKSEMLEDKDNWFFKSVIKKLTERMFYRNWENFSKFHITAIEEGTPLPEFEMHDIWVNYQKQHEFNPLHNHSGLFSFVIFMKIPTHWKEQHALPWLKNIQQPQASDFQFVFPHENKLETVPLLLSPEDEGRMLFFPAWLDHQVYPFYECEEERITISGNIRIFTGNEDEENQKNLKSLEDQVKIMKEKMEYSSKRKKRHKQRYG